jgi:hypothetical protein
MSLNTSELIKIRKATSGSEQTKQIVSDYIIQFSKEIEELKKLEAENQNKSLLSLMNQESQKRRLALKSGVSSYSDPVWAGPAACETWTHSLLGKNEIEIREVEKIIGDLTNEKRIEETNSSKVGYFICIILAGFTFYFLNWWSALIVFFIGTIVLGWSRRYDR